MSVYFEQYNIVTSLGNSINETWNNLVKNNSGVNDLKKLNIVASDFSVTAGAPYKNSALPDVNANSISDEYRHLIRLLASELKPGTLPIDALVLASNINTIEQNLSGKTFCDSLCLKYIQEELTSKGFVFSNELETVCLYNTCISGLSALNLAHDFLSAGNKKQVLVITLEPRLRQWALMPLEFLNMLNRTSEVRRASVPFSSDRGGFVKGDGSAMAILGKEPQSQNAVELAAVAEVNDRFRLTDPDENGKGLELSILQALSKSHISPSQIDYVSAHATGTLKYDKIEARVLETLFSSSILVGALKSQIGHTNISSGLIASIIAVESLKKQWALPVLNLKKDPEIGSLAFVSEAISKSMKHILVNASGIGGNNAAAILRLK